METQFQSLYNAIHIYKKSLIEILDKIEKNLWDTVSKCSNSASLSYQKKHIFTKQMVEMLQNYVQMLYLGENMYEHLVSKIKEIEHEEDVIETCHNTNPFLRNTHSNDRTFEAATHFKTESQDDVMNNFEEITEDKSDLLVELVLEEIPISDVKEEESIVKNDEHLDNNLLLKSSIDDTNRNKEEQPIVESEETSDCKLLLESSIDATNKNQEEYLSVEKQEVSFSAEPELTSTPDKKQTRQVTFKLNNEENLSESSAVTKLKEMPYFDRREEALKALLDNNVMETLEWTKMQKRENDKKSKEKNPILDIPEDVLCVKDFCSFCFVQSPSEFYVRTNQQLFEKLEIKLNDEMNNQKFVVNNFKSKEEAKSYIGKFGVAFFQNKRKWYRIEILDWIDTEPEDIFIQLIDYGNKMYWNYTNVKSLSDFFSVFPKMAIRCHLAGVYSPDIQNRTKWPKQSRKFFASLARMEHITQFMVIFVYKENNSYGVDLLKENDPNETTLGQLLVESGHACQMQIETDYFIQDDFEEMNINEVITGYNAQDEARICPFTNKYGRCFKGPSCKLEHGQLAKDGVTTDKIPTMNQPLTTIALPLVGETVDILITGYITTCHFYAHILTNRSNSNLYNDNFLKLKDTMKANNLVPTYERFKIFPGLAEFVLVQEGIEWLRGTCVGYGDNEEIEIFLVDFGYTVFKKLKDLRQMKEDFLHVPFQAIECILDNCQEKMEVTEETSRNFFDTCMHMQIFQAIVIESTEPLRVQLWDSSNMDMRHVLKQYGIGEDQIANLYPPQDYILSCH